MATPELTNGVLNLVQYETPPLIRWPVVTEDTFIRRIGVTQVGFDYTGSTAILTLRDGKNGTGNIVYQDVTIPLYEIVIPTSPTETGSASFTLSIPTNITASFIDKKNIYGVCRILKPTSVTETLFLIDLTVIKG